MIFGVLFKFDRRVEAVARDGVKIPVSFIYNKYKVNENSVVILHGEYYSDKAMKRGYLYILYIYKNKKLNSFKT